MATRLRPEFLDHPACNGHQSPGQETKQDKRSKPTNVCEKPEASLDVEVKEQGGQHPLPKHRDEECLKHGCRDASHILSHVSPGPLVTDELTTPKGVSKATVQRCISKLSPYWTDEQLDQVVELFQSHGLL